MNTHHESSTITNAACVTLRVSSTCITPTEELEDDATEAHKQLKRNTCTPTASLHRTALKPGFPSLVELLHCCLHLMNSAALQCPPAARVRHPLPAPTAINPLR